ncbi:MAG: hypothetical protein DDG59_04820 [Anaerolineae bacterium]|jgi:hypothetical protein|nr:MAG: hypothetical protein DDG59_04820 [Anaerolineae bacterium]
MRLRGLGVLLYLLGLSYGAVALAIQALRTFCISPEQAQTDLRSLLKLVEERPQQGVVQIQRLLQSCCAARAPNVGEKACLADRWRNLFLDRWQL